MVLTVLCDTGWGQCLTVAQSATKHTPAGLSYNHSKTMYMSAQASNMSLCFFFFFATWIKYFSMH